MSVIVQFVVSVSDICDAGNHIVNSLKYMNIAPRFGVPLKVLQLFMNKKQPNSIKMFVLLNFFLPYLQALMGV